MCLFAQALPLPQGGSWRRSCLLRCHAGLSLLSWSVSPRRTTRSTASVFHCPRIFPPEGFGWCRRAGGSNEREHRHGMMGQGLSARHCGRRRRRATLRLSADIGGGWPPLLLETPDPNGRGLWVSGPQLTDRARQLGPHSAHTSTGNPPATPTPTGRPASGFFSII